MGNLTHSYKGWEIKIIQHIKKLAPDKYQPLLSFSTFEARLEVCVATCLLHYIEGTTVLRTQDNTSLFVSTKKPHELVHWQTLDKQIKAVLKDSGIDMSRFLAHSTRHASTSAARGANIDLIKRTAGLSPNFSVFAKFYNRPIRTNRPDYVSFILSTRDLPNPSTNF